MTKMWQTVAKSRRAANFGPGDTVRVFLKVSEGEAERTQAFEGVVIGQRGAGVGESFTVRKTSFGVGVERTFPLQSPRIEKIVKVKGGKVRRAKLYYLRERTGRAARLEETTEKVGGPVSADGVQTSEVAPVAEKPEKLAAPAGAEKAAQQV